jgi:ankyrin repeat protein
MDALNLHDKKLQQTLATRKQTIHTNQKLLKAVELNDLAQTKKYIETNATLHTLSGLALRAYNEEHEGLLHIAVKLNHIEIVEYLLSIGCSANIKTRRARSPLHYSTYKNVSPSIIESLLLANADTENQDDDNASALIWACYLGNLAALKILLKHKADPKIKDRFEFNSLDWAAYEAQIDVVIFLMDLNIYSTEEVHIAYENAIEAGHSELVEIMRNKM